MFYWCFLFVLFVFLVAVSTHRRTKTILPSKITLDPTTEKKTALSASDVTTFGGPQGHVNILLYFVLVIALVDIFLLEHVCLLNVMAVGTMIVLRS